MSVAELKDICEARNVRKIAMVDDVFDIPAPDGLDLDRYNEFRQKYNSDQSLRSAVARVGGRGIEVLPTFEDLEDDQVECLWKATWKPRIGGRRLRADHADAFHGLFVGHRDDLLGMLAAVVDLLSLFRNELNREVSVHGTDFDANEVSKAEIVVVDYFLGQNLTKEQAFKKALDAVTQVIAAARLPRRTVPSFLLVSSRPSEIEIDRFRRSAKLMKSRFRFFPKEALRPENVEDMVNLHDLVDASDRTEIVERLIEDWEKGAGKAIDSVRDLMLALDVSDLVYLDCFRLSHEGTSIGNYLRWFLTASLNAKVTSKLTKKLWKDAGSIRLFSVVDDSGNLDHTTLIKTFDGPSDAIAHAYGDILFDEARGPGDAAFPARLPSHDLLEGDLFVRPKGKDRRGYDGAEVRLVMTPSCDLRIRLATQELSERSVLLLPGILNKITQEDTKENFADGYFVRVLERDEWCLLRVDWKFRHPISVTWQQMQEVGPGTQFMRLGRIRDLYFHKIREEFVNGLARIGTEVAPLLPHSRGGEVLIAVGDGGRKKYKSVMSFGHSDGFVWEIGPIRVRGKSRQTYVYQSSRQFLSRIHDALQRFEKDNPEWSESVRRSLDHLNNMRTYMDLVRPIPPGIRGEGNAVDVKKAVLRSKKELRSSADLLIVTFVD